MKKKKIITVIAAVAVVASLALGSLAFFTSRETVKNSFSTESFSDKDNGGDQGIDIHENFDKDIAKKMLPGDTVNKEAWVQSTANYDQILRVKITKSWNNQKVTLVDKATGTSTNYTLNNDKINVKDSDKVGTDWIKGSDGYYYYNQILKPNTKTSKVIDSVTLPSDLEKEYSGQAFDVIVIAESLQATKDAASGWENIPAELKGNLNAVKTKDSTAKTSTELNHGDVVK
ncbi:BsaA family SipW-dependent biofilm matrix protein [Clostridium sp.]|uniref:BsaA family SipW-dependent biofilm matrix protein n=1 Tax=Clostridium sp. TaxID=1506 RepID=UPI002FC857A7